MATATRPVASPTMSDPYWLHRFTPASTPSSVACMQKPAIPAASSATLSSRESTNTWPDHSGDVPTTTPAETTPTRTATRIGWIRGPATVGSAGGGLCLTDFAGGFLKQAVGGAGEKPEGAPEHGEHREAGGFEVTRGQVEHRIAEQRAHHGRDADPGDAASGHGALGGYRRGPVGHRSGTAVEYSQACHSGRNDSSA